MLDALVAQLALGMVHEQGFQVLAESPLGMAVVGTVAAYEQLTGQRFEAWLERTA